MTLLISALLGKLVKAGKDIPGSVVKSGKEGITWRFGYVDFEEYNLILGNRLDVGTLC
jgi:hypothetical protein